MTVGRARELSDQSLAVLQKLLAVAEAAEGLDLQDLHAGLQWMASETDYYGGDESEALDRLETALAALDEHEEETG